MRRHSANGECLALRVANLEFRCERHMIRPVESTFSELCKCSFHGNPLSNAFILAIYPTLLRPCHLSHVPHADPHVLLCMCTSSPYIDWHISHHLLLALGNVGSLPALSKDLAVSGGKCSGFVAWSISFPPVPLAFYIPHFLPVLPMCANRMPGICPSFWMTLFSFSP